MRGSLRHRCCRCISFSAMGATPLCAARSRGASCWSAPRRSACAILSRRRFAAGLPGVLVHAEIIDQIISGKFITRPDWAVGLEIVVAIGLGLGVLLFLPWLSTFANALVVTGALGLSVGRRMAGLRKLRPAALADPAGADLPIGLRRSIGRQAAAQRKRKPVHTATPSATISRRPWSSSSWTIPTRWCSEARTAS